MALGWAVSLSWDGDFVAVGAPWVGRPGKGWTGGAYVFKYNAISSSYKQIGPGPFSDYHEINQGI